MRRSLLLALALLIILGSLTALIVFRVKRSARRPPTQSGWRARVTTLAGDGSPSFRDASQRTQAAFADPFGIAISGDGVIYVADGGDSNRIRKLAPDGSVTTLAGSVEAYADGPGSQAAFNTPSGLALDAKGDLFVADTGPVSIVVDAFDRTDMNASRRRLGLYSLGYQVLKPDGGSAPGFDQPRINLVFRRLPANRDAPKIAYAEQSGITVYGSATTRFLYNVTNTVRDGRAAPGVWDIQATKRTTTATFC